MEKNLTVTCLSFVAIHLIRLHPRSGRIKHTSGDKRFFAALELSSVLCVLFEAVCVRVFRNEKRWRLRVFSMRLQCTCPRGRQRAFE